MARQEEFPEFVEALKVAKGFREDASLNLRSFAVVLSAMVDALDNIPRPPQYTDHPELDEGIAQAIKALETVEAAAKRHHLESTARSGV